MISLELISCEMLAALWRGPLPLNQVAGGAIVLALLVEHLEEIRFAIANVDQLRLRNLAGDLNQIAVMLDPQKGLFFFNRNSARGPSVRRRFAFGGDTLSLRHPQGQSVRG